MQVTIAKQLGLEPTTVGNFFMNARRRSMDKWKDEDGNGGGPPGGHHGGMKSPGSSMGDADGCDGSVSLCGSPSPTSSPMPGGSGADHHLIQHHSLATDAL